jgi:hypothetical protein
MRAVPLDTASGQSLRWAKQPGVRLAVGMTLHYSSCLRGQLWTEERELGVRRVVD